jgi:hypothetical protein
LTAAAPGGDNRYVIETPRCRTFRAALSAALVLVVVGLGALIPLLDAGRDPGRLAVAEAPAPDGAYDHDHRVCLQFGSAAWFPTDQDGLRLVIPIRDVALAPANTAGPDAPSRSSHRSRAPPTA